MFLLSIKRYQVQISSKYLQKTNSLLNRKSGIQNTLIFHHNHSCMTLSTSTSLAQEASYHDVADASLNEIVDLLSILESDNFTILSKDDIEIALSQGVLKLDLGTKGAWVINKQTPNRQLWWSSPLSGPRRYEYYTEPNKQSDVEFWKTFEKAYSTGMIKYSHRWRSTRDGSLLLMLLRTEILKTTNVDIAIPNSTSKPTTSG